MTDYNIKSGVPLILKTQHEVTTYKFHPYGLSSFREDILDFVREKKEKGLSFAGYDNLTNAWRTPWDVQFRYHDLMSPLNRYVTSVCKELHPEFNWYHHTSWIAQYDNCSGANLHDHDYTLNWSYCYYVKVPDDGPGFMIQDGLSQELYQLNITDGDILFFRSFLPHQVLPSVGERVVISGNLKTIDLGYKSLEKDYSEFDTEDWTNIFA